MSRYFVDIKEKAQLLLAFFKKNSYFDLRSKILRSKLRINANLFGSLLAYSYLCSKLLKLRHSFLNGYGRPRTAFLLY